MKIYTKTGDKGETSLWGGRRVSKSNARIEAYGTIDELNAQIGMLIAELLRAKLSVSSLLGKIQNDLFSIGSMLAADPLSTKSTVQIAFDQDAISDLEVEMDRLDEALPPLQNFILPSGSAAIASAHICRTICRRAERRVVALEEGKREELDLIVRYLNRLSDYFFVCSRSIAQESKIKEVIWQRPKSS